MRLRAVKRSLNKVASVALIAVSTALVSVTARAGSSDHPPAAGSERLFQEDNGANWATYGRTHTEDHYSPLAQINAGNVANLRLAWYVDLPTSVTSVSAPLAIDGILYVAEGLSVVRAIEATTGRVLWTYDPAVAAIAGDMLKTAWGIRGLAFWDNKVYVGTQDGRLIAISAQSGKPLWSVHTTVAGDGLYITGAPRIFGGKVIIGNGGADHGAARGYVTTYDAMTGKQLWRFFTVPGDPNKGFENQAMEMAAKTWTGEWWKFGGGGTVWNSITYDVDLNRVYIGTGNGSPWNRKIRSPDGGDNLFLCSIVALDASTGQYLWHYQTNPGESWDYNSAMDIELATLSIKGEPRRVILHAPKNGFFYIIDRDTGKLISAEPFARTTWATKIDIATGRPVETSNARYTNDKALIFPSSLGAHNWQPMSFSHQSGLVYIPTTEWGFIYSDKGIDPKTWRFSKDIALNIGVDVNPAPGESVGGSLQAWDPIAQRRIWSVTLQSPFNGGAMSTGGGLVFAGEANGNLAARDASTGKTLWNFAAQNGVLSEPITYLANGKQRVTVVTGFGGPSANFGKLSTQFGWDYRTQKRRVLTFSLGGRAQLPRMQKATATEPLSDPSFHVDSAKADAGAAVYQPRCFYCHGAGAVAGGNAPDLRASSIPLTQEAFNQVVHGGLLVPHGMPLFDKLSDEELENLRHYIRREAQNGQ